MTPAKLKRKTKNRLLTYARGVENIILDHGYRPGSLDYLHDFAMRCYAEGYTHGEAVGREKEESNA